MKYIKDENVKLVLCGKGDLYEYACSQSEKDKRILALGQLSPMEAKDWQKKSSVLVNPRCDRDEYTKYSFPSKNIEYLLSGKPTVAYMLSGIPQIYRNFFFEISPEGEPSQEIAKAVENALRKSKKEVLEKKNAFLSYANEKLCAKNIAVKIIKLNF
jgi:glycosyltransferase involved in cell wall biosynthesis